ncbi:MAG: ABC transporter ATP-binding protein [Planctomycetota bacterium]
MSVLDVRDLSVTFADPRTPGSARAAVDGVSFTLARGETLGLVGESGSGKSLTCLALMRLLPRNARIEARTIELGGRDLRAMSERELTRVRGRELALVFQDPMSALHPLLTIGRQLAEVLEVHANATRRDARRRAAEALESVGIAHAHEQLDAYPNQFSGGMRQRVAIAMALLMRPKVLLADEPTTALDVTVQAQILDLFAELSERHGTALLLVTHSLGVVAGLCDRVAVMYAGRIVESAPTVPLFRAPRHPYTRALLACQPRASGDVTAPLAAIAGTPPPLGARASGCAFAPRCTHAVERCASSAPSLALEGDPVTAGGDTHASACWRANELDLVRAERDA